MHEARLAALAERFRRFAEECRPHSSPLYEQLSLHIAGDTEMLALAASTPRNPVPNLLFAAVHFLLLQGTQHPVADFYPSVSTQARSPADAFDAFRSFCRDHDAKIRELMATRFVQTNEVRRCACLLPAFGIVGRLAQGRPLALVEIGASAGLNLLWDRYGYDYGEGRRCGEAGSPVQITCQLRGELRPPLPAPLPTVAYRVGLDLNPLDLRDAVSRLWLRALIWPEHQERAVLLERAIEVTRHEPLELIAGDALDLRPEVLAAVPPNCSLCLFHSYTLNQFQPAVRERFRSLSGEHAAVRDLTVISLEGLGGPPVSTLSLTSFANRVATERLLARCHGHGEWMEWLESQSASLRTPQKADEHPTVPSFGERGQDREDSA